MIITSAAGRVNLIGGHVDFHEGLVVSMAIDRSVRVSAGGRDDGRITARSSAFDGVVEMPADGSQDPRTVEPPWGRLVAGVTRSLAERGRPPVGLDASITSDLGRGGGLSSSAAFEVAVGLALARVAGFAIAGTELALATQAAEHLATGVPCGIQDQLTSVAGGVVLIDCRTLEVRSLELPRGSAVVVVDSGVSRTLEASPWSQRRAESFADAAALGLSVLRDATPELVAGRPRAEHVVAEIERVRRFVDAFEQGDAAAAGRLMTESHESSRDRWGSSVPELDAAVQRLLDAGAFGARLTGGGFGGYVVGLVPDELVGRIGLECRVLPGMAAG